MQAAIAGVIAALATGGISLIEAMDRVAQIFEEGSTIERRPPLPDPVDPANPDGPGEDGMYDWGGRRVSPEDYARPAGRGSRDRGRPPGSNRRPDLAHGERGGGCCSFRRPRRRSADDDRRARDALAEELETLRNQTRTRERVTDILDERARAGGWDSIAERLTRGDASDAGRTDLDPQHTRSTVATARHRRSRRDGDVLDRPPRRVRQGRGDRPGDAGAGRRTHPVRPGRGLGDPQPEGSRPDRGGASAPAV